VRGAKPLQRWSHTMTLGARNDTLWLIGGCAPPIATYDGITIALSDAGAVCSCTLRLVCADVWSFHIGLEVQPSNVQAYGPGLSSAQAGATTSFQLQMRASKVSANRTVVFGDPLIWGSGLSSSLTVQAVGSFSGRATLDLGTVVDLGDGLYNATYR
jgi:hypothetical protein